MGVQTVHQRLNISHPDTTLRQLDRVVSKADRGKFFDRAARTELARTKRRELRRQLEDGYRCRAKEDRRLTAEWFPLEEEAWQTAQIETSTQRIRLHRAWQRALTVRWHASVAIHAQFLTRF